MRRMVWSVLVGLCVCAPNVSASDKVASGPQTTVTNYLFCTASESAHQMEDGSMKPAIYYSAAFTTAGNDLNPVYAAFFQFLKDKYGYTGEQTPGMSQQCYGLHSLDEAAAARQKSLSKSQQYSQQQAVVETGWTYSAP